ncbi:MULTISPECIES: arginase family protein [Bacteroides]|uniref:Arginase family protein n=2 Tax=Bacteroides TaxID=816 RepID=A0A412XTC3_BACFG|nr:arginase family protein [Bacteroides fragilis]RGV85523.1 arginase family protein [Bacteroides fragilis]
MKHKFLLLVVLSMIGTTYAKSDDMKADSSKTLRLIYPQWQGGVVANWMPDIPANDVSRGYFLGAQLLQILAPESKQQTVEVPISLDIKSHKEEKGISGYRAIIKQSKDALDLIRKENPDRIVTLGGECSVSVVPFTYLSEKYPDDVAVVWIDAHPDLNLPGDSYTGYHAMALTACFGMGDKEIMDILPAKLNPAKSIIVGLRTWDDTNASKERQEQIGVKSLLPACVIRNSTTVLDWLKTTGASKVVIHFDLDALDPAEIIAAVGTDPDGLKIETVVRVINDIAKEYDVVGLTIAEPMPRVAIKIKNMLNQMPLLK